MAKIIKVGPKTITPNKVANPFKTSRTATTNPFKYSNFEGNTLQFADVFEGFEPKQINKIKMVVSSVAGSINKMHKGIIEPISAFVGRVKGGVASAWDYANKTNISDLPVIRDITVNVNAFNETMADRLASVNKGVKNFGKGITSKFGVLNTDITDIGHALSEKWTNMISKYHHTNKITSETTVAELEVMLRTALEGAV